MQLVHLYKRRTSSLIYRLFSVILLLNLNACAEQQKPNDELSDNAQLNTTETSVENEISSNAQCTGTPQKVTGSVYCDNVFTLWVNGKEIVTDPVSFTPHQAVRVEFEWDGSSDITYAIQCEDYASPSGYEYIGTGNPKLGDGALIADFNDGLASSTNGQQWRVYTATYGPTDESILAGCSASNLDACVVESRPIPNGWQNNDFDDSQWQSATQYSAAQAGWGRTPTWSEEKGCCTVTSPVNRESLGCDQNVEQAMCLNPREEFSGSSAKFIWAGDLERDNRVLFRYTAQCQKK